MPDLVAAAAGFRAAQDELAEAVATAAADRAAGERLAAARELHDIVGHAVAGLGMQAAVAHAYARRDPDRARRAAATAAEVAAEAERDLSRLGALLDGTVAAPTASVRELVAGLRDAGMTVRLDGDLDAAGLTLPAALVAYRVVQEALTNVRRHAPGAAAAVSLRRAGDRLVVVVENGTGGTGGSRGTGGGGRGLEGMRERVERLGGTVDAGPAPGGGWVVRAMLPAHHAPAPAAAAAVG